MRLPTAVVVVLLVGGCSDPEILPEGSEPAPARSGPATAVVHDRWESCDKAVTTEGPDAFDLPLLEGTFPPVAAIICDGGAQDPASSMPDLVAGEPHAEELTAVVAALRLPDQDRTLGACMADLPMVPWLALLDGDGRWIRPGIPADECGKPRTELREAYYALVMGIENSGVPASRPAGR